MKFDYDSFSNQILNFLAFFSLKTFDISTWFLVLSFTLWIMSFNSHSIADENRVGYNVAKIYTRSKKMECAQMDMEKLDLHHSFLKCCWPQIHPYYILDNILMADSQWPCLKNSLKRWRRKEAKSIFDQG